MITTINNKHNKLNFSNEREQSQACLNSAEHEKNQGRKVLNVPNLRFPEFQEEWERMRLDAFTERIMRKNKNNQSKLPLTISAQYGLVDQITFFNKVIASTDMSPHSKIIALASQLHKSWKHRRHSDVGSGLRNRTSG